MLTHRVLLFNWFVTGFIVLLLLFPFMAADTYAENSVMDSYFDTKALSLTQNDTTEVNIFLKSQAGDKVSGATIFINYSPHILEYLETAASQPNDECTKKNYALNQTLSTKNDKKKGIVEITKVLIAQDSELPSGEFCLETLTFKAKSSFWFIIPWFKRSGTISFSDTDNWQTVGPDNQYTFSEKSAKQTVSVTVTN